MVRLKFLSITVVVSIFTLAFSLSGALLASADSAGCTSSSIKLGGCAKTGAGIDGNDVVVKVDLSRPDSGKSGDSSVGKSDDSKSNGSNGSLPNKPAGPTVFRDGYTVTAPLTLSDIARFRPDPGVDLMQPNGWMIVGLSSNFYARANQHVKTGPLLGQPASVRFTPARYSWTYGDGATRTTSTPGATWSSLGINEFDETPTSHIYRAPGKYFIDLTIGYTPEYRYASGAEWIPISGIVWVPANRLQAEASAGAKTLLFERECTINPTGQGC